MSYRAKVALVYLLGFSLDLVNMFVANVAYPEIGHELRATVTQLAWVGNAYMLGLTAIIPLSVWLAAVLGERRLIAASLALFALASVGVAQAGSIETLIGWRLVQGLGGGLLIPVGQAMAYRNYPVSERAGLTSRMMLVALLIPALSPALGGLIVDHASWRWIFYANVPLALLPLLLTGLWFKPDVRPAQRPVFSHRGLWSAAQVARIPLLRLAMLVYLCVPGVFIGTQLVAILYLRGLGASAAQTGALMLPWALASGVAIVFGKRYFNRIGPKPLLLAGMLAQALGILLLALIVDPHGALPIIAYGLMGLGGSLCSSSAYNCAFLDIDPPRMGQASAVWNINRQLSFCFGAALLMGLLDLFGSNPAGFRECFLIAAALTLLPLLVVFRLDTPAVLALLTPKQGEPA
ncbi:MFS transporter [Pseudomonas batumici]|uniref:Inner membrane component of tripartite multidrug resistance system n=1 Tax=Pseudomonas batumici TaxID=226910 RepID=A0A0C2F2L2_9PSED|nr:MFS transporter [Pseudomonas batumici]KIH85268.1 Inner membrane component of tripartite multidrug resistance system [Pseudomonas batumici]